MKVLKSEGTVLHEIAFDAEEVLKLRACGVLQPWCLVPAHHKLSVLDMRRTAELLDGEDKLAVDLRNMADHLAPTSANMLPPDTLVTPVHVLLRGVTLCTRMLPNGQPWIRLGEHEDFEAVFKRTVWRGPPLKMCDDCLRSARELSNR